MTASMKESSSFSKIDMAADMGDLGHETAEEKALDPAVLYLCYHNLKDKEHYNFALKKTDHSDE
jgi:hypothetical protein